MFHKFKKTIYSLGVDVNLSSINLVLLKKRNNEPQLCADIQYAINFNIALQENLLEAVAMLKKEYGLPRGKVIVGLSDEKVMQKELLVAKNLRECDVEWQIKQFSQDYFPGMAEELIIDFIRITDVDNGNNDYIKLFAVKAAEIMDKIHLLKGAGLKVSIIEPEIHSLIRLAIWCQKKLAQQAVTMYVYLSETNIKLAVIEETLCLFSNHQANFFSYQDNWSGYLLALEQSIASFCQQNSQKSIQKIMVVNNVNCSNSLLSKIKEHFNIDADFLRFNFCLPDKLIVNREGQQKFSIAAGLALRGVV